MKHFIIYKDVFDRYGMHIYADDFTEDIHHYEVRFYKNNEVIVSIPIDRIDRIDQEEE